MASVVGDDDHKRILIEVYEQISVSNIRQIFYLKKEQKKTQEFYFLPREWNCSITVLYISHAWAYYDAIFIIWSAFQK